MTGNMLLACRGGQVTIKYGMPSAEFYQKFEQGELGDAMDFFERVGLFELQQDLLGKGQRLEAI
jgi:hypothetical protein